MSYWDELAIWKVCNAIESGYITEKQADAMLDRYFTTRRHKASPQIDSKPLNNQGQ